MLYNLVCRPSYGLHPAILGGAAWLPNTAKYTKHNVTLAVLIFKNQQSALCIYSDRVAVKVDVEALVVLYKVKIAGAELNRHQLS